MGLKSQRGFKHEVGVFQMEKGEVKQFEEAEQHTPRQEGMKNMMCSGHSSGWIRKLSAGVVMRKVARKVGQDCKEP